jgi:hypothetical protein
MIYRDVERGDRVTIAFTADLIKMHWTLQDLTTEAVGSWEPSADVTRWTRDRVLDLFVQKTDQLDSGDATTRIGIDATLVHVLEWTPPK